jgi:2OG-Fe(II) oxygenase superfamily
MGKNKVKSAGAVTKSSEAPSQIKFPPLVPLIPTSSLILEECHKHQILLIRNFFTSTLCRNLVSNFSTLPFATTPGKPKRGEATRVNDRFQIDDPAFAERLWKDTALQDLVLSYEDQSIWGDSEVLGLFENIRIYRYSPGQFFDKHYDESKRIEFGPRKIKSKTTWTLLIYLTTCEGGETVFYPESTTSKGPQPDPIVVGLEPGMALLHKHGDDCLLHEGREVTHGEKWVLRSDLVVAR